MQLSVNHLGKRYAGDIWGCGTSLLRSGRASSACSGQMAPASRRSCACWPPSPGRPTGRSPGTARTSSNPRMTCAMTMSGAVRAHQGVQHRAHSSMSRALCSSHRSGYGPDLHKPAGTHVRPRYRAAARLLHVASRRTDSVGPSPQSISRATPDARSSGRPTRPQTRHAVAPVRERRRCIHKGETPLTGHRRWSRR